MNSIKEHLTESYSQVDDFFQTHPQLQRQRRSHNHPPIFTDNEVMALGLMQGYFRTADLKRVFLLVLANDARAFSAHITYQQWLHRLHALAPQIQALLAATGTQVYGTACVYLMDSKPIPVCLPLRHGRVRLLRDEGAAFGKTSKGWFFGFKLHLIRDLAGRILNVVLTPGNWTDTDAALALGFNVAGGVVVADLGYLHIPKERERRFRAVKGKFEERERRRISRNVKGFARRSKFPLGAISTCERRFRRS